MHPLFIELTFTTNETNVCSPCAQLLLISYKPSKRSSQLHKLPPRRANIIPIIRHQLNLLLNVSKCDFSDGHGHQQYQQSSPASPPRHHSRFSHERTNVFTTHNLHNPLTAAPGSVTGVTQTATGRPGPGPGSSHPDAALPRRARGFDA